MKRKGKNGQNTGSVEVQSVEEKPWEDNELRILDEALPRLKECHLEKVPRLYKVEEPNRLCEKHEWKWKWKDLMVRRRKESQGAVALVQDLAKAFERNQSPSDLGVGNALQFPEEDIAGVVWLLLSTRGECSSKDVWRSRSRPLRPSCQGGSGLVCFYVLYCRMR